MVHLVGELLLAPVVYRDDRALACLDGGTQALEDLRLPIGFYARMEQKQQIVLVDSDTSCGLAAPARWPEQEKACPDGRRAVA